MGPSDAAAVSSIQRTGNHDSCSALFTTFAAPGGAASTKSGRQSCRSLQRDIAADPGSSLHSRHVGFSTRLELLMPGLLQHRWGPRRRRWVFFGSFVSALIIALWTWGTVPREAFLVFAYTTVRLLSLMCFARCRFRCSLPNGRSCSWRSRSGSSLICPSSHPCRYWLGPGLNRRIPGIGFLVDRYAYRVKGPRRASGTGSTGPLWKHRPRYDDPGRRGRVDRAKLGGRRQEPHA